MNKEKKKKDKVCEICDKKSTYSFSYSKGKKLHSCKKHYLVVSIMAMKLSEVYSKSNPNQ